MNTIIHLGHYQEKSTLGSDSPIIIRVLGEDTKKEGYWLIENGKSIPEYILTEGYVLLDTSYKEENLRKLPPASIFAGIGEETEIPIISEDIHERNVGVLTTNKNNFVLTPIVEEIKIPFDISILDKINIDTLNQRSFESFGVEKYKKPIIDINLPIEFNYDITKLIQTIELLDLNENIIVDFLVNQISLNSLKPLLKQKIKELLHEQPVKIEVQPIIEEIKPIEKIQTNISEINSDLQDGISDIDNFIKTTFNK